MTAENTESRILHQYNSLGLAEQEEERYGNANKSTTGKIIQWDFDAQGRVTALRYPAATSANGQLAYRYDALNRVTKATRANGGGSPPDLAGWAFRGGGVVKMTNGNGTWCDVAYDSRKRVTSVHHKRTDGGQTESIAEFSYTYDAAVRQESESQKPNSLRESTAV